MINKKEIPVTIILALKDALDCLCVDDCLDNQIAIAQASYDLYRAAAKKTNIEPDKYLVAIDDALQPIFSQYRISQSVSKKIQNTLLNIQNSQETQTRQAFHALNLLYNNYLLKSDFLRDEQQELKNEWVVIKNKIKINLMNMAQEIQNAKQHVKTEQLEIYHQKLMKLIQNHFALSLDQQIIEYPALQVEIEKICAMELDEIEQLDEKIRLVDLLRDFVYSLINLVKFHHRVSTPENERTNFFKVQKSELEEKLTNQLMGLVTMLEDASKIQP